MNQLFLLTFIVVRIANATSPAIADSNTQKTTSLSAIAMLRQHDSEIKALLEEAGDSLSATMRQRVKDRINATFDLQELARLSLGDHWEQRSFSERNHFVDVFSAIIEERNLDTFLQYYRDGQILYGTEDRDGNRSLVHATAPLKRGEKVEILYHLHRVGKQWRVYDLVIDGASTSAGNRRQYVRRIKKRSYASLIQALEKQLARMRPAPN